MPNKYFDSFGNSYTQATINKKWTETKHGLMAKYICECCGKNQTQDPDHTISRARCKELHRVELIFLEDNISWSCRTCHMEHESYKSGKFSHHKNAYKRMVFTAIYDLEGFIKRFHCITNEKLKEQLKETYNQILEETP